MIKNEDV